MKIKRINGNDEMTGKFISEAFSDYSRKSGVVLNYDEFCFVAENENGEIIGAVTGRAYYNEVHIGDLIIDENFRRLGTGSKLVKAVEDEYRNRGYGKITLSTFGFQAPDFYRKLGYSLEFVREDKDPRLSKYFFAKAM